MADPRGPVLSKILLSSLVGLILPMFLYFNPRPLPCHPHCKLLVLLTQAPFSTLTASVVRLDTSLEEHFSHCCIWPEVELKYFLQKCGKFSNICLLNKSCPHSSKGETWSNGLKVCTSHHSLNHSFQSVSSCFLKDRKGQLCLLSICPQKQGPPEVTRFILSPGYSSKFQY